MERERALSEYDHVHVERLEVGWTVRVLVEGAETDKVIVSEQLNFLASLLHQDIFNSEGMDAKHLAKHFHFGICGIQHVQPPSVSFGIPQLIV